MSCPVQTYTVYIAAVTVAMILPVILCRHKAVDEVQNRRWNEL